MKAQGAEIAIVDSPDVERVADALQDVQRTYFCPSINPYMFQGAPTTDVLEVMERPAEDFETIARR